MRFSSSPQEKCRKETQKQLFDPWPLLEQSRQNDLLGLRVSHVEVRYRDFFTTIAVEIIAGKIVELVA